MHRIEEVLDKKGDYTYEIKVYLVHEKTGEILLTDKEKIDIFVN